MNDEWISIAEFAKRAGVSRQAIQQRLNTSLREFVKVEQGKKQGKKWLNTAGLRLFDGASLAQGFDKDLTRICQGSNDEKSGAENALIEMLRDELKAKDKQIEKLQQMLEQQAKLLDQEQQLHAAATQRILLLEESAQRRKPWWRFWER